MKFTISKTLLDRQLQFVSRIVTVRQSVPVLSNILIETDGKIVRLSGTDLELAVTTYLPADIEQEGAFTVPAKMFQEFVHQNPDEELKVSLESFELVCVSNKVQARIPGMDPEEYPALPKVENAKRIVLPLQGFVDRIKQVVIACATDQARPILTGVNATFQEDMATFAATDSFRLVERSMKIVPVGEPLSLIIPARTLQEIVRIAAALPDVTDLEMEITNKQLLCRIGNVELYSRLIAGNFIKYHSIIPTTSVAVVDITTTELIQALRLSYVFSQSGISNVMLEVNEAGELTVASHGSQRGSTRNQLYAVVQEGFQPIKAAFNAKYLLDACQATGADHLQLRFSGLMTALVITTDETDYLQLVMPIRV